MPTTSYELKHLSSTHLSSLPRLHRTKSSTSLASTDSEDSSGYAPLLTKDASSSQSTLTTLTKRRALPSSTSPSINTDIKPSSTAEDDPTKITFIPTHPSPTSSNPSKPSNAAKTKTKKRSGRLGRLRRKKPVRIVVAVLTAMGTLVVVLTDYLARDLQDDILNVIV